MIHTDGYSKLGLSVFLTDDQRDTPVSILIANKNRYILNEDDMFESDDDVNDILGDDKKARIKYIKSALKAGYLFGKSFFTKKWEDRDQFSDPKMTSYVDQCLDLKIDLMDIFKSETKITKSFYTYQGSDTEPPCNEGM